MTNEKCKTTDGTPPHLSFRILHFLFPSHRVLCVLCGEFSCFLVLLGFATPLRAAEICSSLLPDGLGVNIHFTDPRPGEMKMLAEGGFRWVRMDFNWNGTERQAGQYDFAAYDRLMAALAPHNIRAMLILDYSNRLYDNGLSPCSDAGRAAFARWAAAAAKHFQSRGILWEMYNEPNIGFWKPKPDVQQYIKLAMEVGRALRAAAPQETYIGPATSTIDMTFLEACFQAGLLEYWSAVSVHPYRQKDPETAAAEYARLRQLIGRYAPKGKQVPILSGEWGYSAVWGKMDPAKQGRMLPRQWLTNLANDLPLSIWYDWHDDGTNPKDAEHHFGTVAHAYTAGREPVYDPKPTYLAAKTFTRTLAGLRFNKRLAVGGDGDYVLLLAEGDRQRLAVWTTAATPHCAVIPVSPGRFAVIGHTGESLPSPSAGERGLAVTLTDAPRYLVPEQPNDLLRVAAAWQRAPLEIRLPAQRGAKLALSATNPLGRPLRLSAGAGDGVEVPPGARAELATSFDVPRTVDPSPLRVELKIGGLGSVAQLTQTIATNPLSVLLLPPAGKSLCVRVENPSGEPFSGTVELTDVTGLTLSTARVPLQLDAGQRQQTVSFTMAAAAEPSYRLGVRLADSQGDVQLQVAPTALRIVDDFGRYSDQTLADAYKILPDGDRKVVSTQTLAFGSPADGPPAPGLAALKIAYRFEQGWKFIRLAPAASLRAIEGKPRELLLWVYGDGSGNTLRLRFSDATGQTFQPSGEPMRWTGWRQVRFGLDGNSAGHWGGANDGTVHYPIHWDSLLLIDGPRRATQGEVYVAGPVLEY